MRAHTSRGRQRHGRNAGTHRSSRSGSVDVRYALGMRRSASVEAGTVMVAMMVAVHAPTRLCVVPVMV